MAIADARPVIRRGVTNTIGVWMQDVTGAVITGGLSGLAAVVIKEDGSQGTADNAPGETGTTGYVTLTLSAAECTSTILAVKITCSNTDAVDACLVVYPEQAGDIRADLTAISGSTSTLSTFSTAVGTTLTGTVFNDGGTYAGSATVIYSDDLVDATADLYNGRYLIITSGALAKKATKITDYEKAGGLYGKFTVDSIGSALADNVTFLIL